MKNGKYCLVVTTTESKKNVDEIISSLMEDKLVACVQVDKVSSTFYWKGAISQSEEFRLTMKTLSDKYMEIERSIIGKHNYSLPEIFKIDITDGLPQYFNWVEESLE